MRSITGRNVNDVFPIGMLFLKENGEPVESQHGNTLEYPEPVSICYEEPTERVLFDKQRAINPFLHFFEPLWILAGQNDVKFLADIVSKFKNYSDDGITLYGAYGARMAEQFATAVARLKANPDDRQVVLTIRRADDIHYTGKDQPCFAGETVLPSPEGSFTFAEIARKFSSGEINSWPVFAVDPVSGDMKIKLASKVWKSGFKKVVKVVFDTGLELRVTHDHLLYRKKKVRDYDKVSPFATKLEVNPVTAGNLKPGDSVLATSLDWTGSKGAQWVKKNIYKNTAYDNRQYTHREYYELIYGSIPDKYVIHHIDENNRNNSMYNLSCVHESDHNAIHRIGDNNPMRNMTKDQHSKRAEKWRISYHKRIAEHDVVNHKVVSVEPCLEPEEVYDFHVPDYHNALVGDGVVAHNCNLCVALKIRRNRLNIHVFNRSNDYIWGMTGANMPQFSMLQEYLAGLINVEVGTYHQTTDSMHVYTDNPQWALLKNTPLINSDPYSEGEVASFPLFAEGEDTGLFQKDLKTFFDNSKKWEFYSRYFKEVVEPMWFTFAAHKVNKRGLPLVEHVAASDWRMVTKQWLESKE